MKSMSDGQQQVFTSWKEIASYLGKSVRTVQRWEQELGLPVQRPHMKAKGTVRAYRTELDEWAARTWIKKSSKDNVVILRARQDDVVSEGIETSRELRAAQKRFLEQLQISLNELTESCRKLRESNAQRKSRESAKAGNG